MITALAASPSDRSELPGLVRECLDDLVTYAAHLVGDVDRALEYVAAGVFHASKFPPARISVHGRATLYRAVTRACRQRQGFPPPRRGAVGLLRNLTRRRRVAFRAEFEAEPVRMDTVKRALTAVGFDRRAALLLRDLAGLPYADIARTLECSPEAAGRLLARARREFGSIYREIAI